MSMSEAKVGDYARIKSRKELEDTHHINPFFINDCTKFDWFGKVFKIIEKERFIVKTYETHQWILDDVGCDFYDKKYLRYEKMRKMYEQ